MAQYKEQFILANTKLGYKTAKESGDISEDSIVFVAEEGEEAIYTKDKIFRSVPTGGKSGQILKYNEERDRAEWVDNIDTLSYGVKWRFNQKDPKLQRVGNMELHKTLPIHNSFKACVYNCKDNSVVYWLNPSNWFLKEGSEIIEESNVYDSRCIVTYTNESLFVKVYYRDFSYDAQDAIRNLSVGDSIAFYNKSENAYVEGVIKEIDTTNSSYLKIYLDGIWSDGFNSTIQEVGGSASFYIYNADVIKNPALLDGRDGEVMMYIPEFYIKSSLTSSEGEVRVSQVKIDDSWNHFPSCYVSALPASEIETVPTNYGYLSTLQSGSFVSVARSTSTNIFRAPSAHFWYAGASNIARTSKLNGEHKCPIRAAIRQTNKKWDGMTYIQQSCLFYWLPIIEYANFNLTENYTDDLSPEGFKQGGLGLGYTGYLGLNDNPHYTQNYVNSIGGFSIYGTNTYVTMFGIQDSDNRTHYVSNIKWRGFEHAILPFWPRWVAGCYIDGDAPKTLDNGSKVYKGYVAKTLPTYNNDQPTDILFDTGYPNVSNSSSNYIKEYTALGSECLPLAEFPILDTSNALDYSTGSLGVYKYAIQGFPSTTGYGGDLTMGRDLYLGGGLATTQWQYGDTISATVFKIYIEE